MESINRKVYNSRRLFDINKEIINWDLKKRHGMQKWRGHDKYGFLEFNIYELKNYKNEINNEFPSNYTSNIDWKVDDSIFPQELYNIHIDELKIYADFISSYISGLRGESLDFIFEITFAGFHIIDSWRKHIYGRALIEAFVSCFDEEHYQLGKAHKESYHSDEEINYRMKHYK
ncbi:MAG: hypothetical protein E2600_17170 [Chryseobacterium sp.]|nr:hypothetical protein [Chryseobacterium sp.]